MLLLNHTPASDREKVFEMMAQSARDGVRGHAKAMPVLDSTFVRVGALGLANVEASNIDAIWDDSEHLSDL